MFILGRTCFFENKKAFKIIHIWIWHDLTSNIPLNISRYLIFSTKKDTVKQYLKARVLKICSGFEEIYWNELNRITFILNTESAAFLKNAVTGDFYRIKWLWELCYTFSSVVTTSKVAAKKRNRKRSQKQNWWNTKKLQKWAFDFYQTFLELQKWAFDSY